MPVQDQVGASQVNVASPPGSAKLGRWTQLTGIFFAEHGLLLLYVNGALAGQGPAQVWAASPAGLVRIGNLTPGGTKHDWAGRISDVCLFFNVLPTTDVTLLYKGNAAHPRDGCAALFAKYP